MNTLSDLRSTLEEHAERVPDGEAVVRTAAVRHRVSVVRRRRRAVAAGGLALVVATVIGVVGVQRASSTPPPVVFGVPAPETITSLGYTYRSDGRAETFDGSSSMRLESSTEPRLLSWTTEHATTVRLRLPDGEHWTSRASGFRDFVVIPPGPAGTLRVSAAEGRVGVATYDVTDAQPDGVTRDGVTFRRTVADTPLVAAVIGAKGQTVARTSFTAVSGRVRIGVLCTGAPAGSLVHVAVGGFESSGGCDHSSFDPGSDVRATSELGLRDHRLRVWVSAAHTSKPLPAGSADEVRIGVGLYGPVASERVAGFALDRVIEYGGHSWVLGRAIRMPASPVRFTGGVEPSLAVVTLPMDRAGITRMSFHATGMPLDQTAFSGQGAGSTGPYWVPAGARVTVTRSTPGSLGVGIYTRND
jgi:hypothetical protein